MEGIDIYSKFQTVTDWAKVRAADVGWCYQKLSDGSTTRNPQALRNYAGVLQGGYSFSQPGDPVAHANLLVDQCERYGLTQLNPALDMEDNPAGSGKANIPVSQKAAYAIAFGKQVEKRGHGFTLYANNSDMGIFGAQVNAAVASTFLWLARYGATPTHPYDAWQYTSTGSCPGVTSNGLDRSRGNVPLNLRGSGNVALVDSDKDIIKAALKEYNTSAADWWYGPRFEYPSGNPTGWNFAQVFFDLRNTVRGINTALQAQTQLIVSNEANDITAASLAAALQEGLVTAGISEAVINAVRVAFADLPDVQVDADALSSKIIEDLGARLASHTA